jgi:dihydroflavonol-4-reductase
MILVTGGTGLVGAHLLLHLVENEDKVCAIYRNAKTIEKPKALFRQNNKEHLFSKIAWLKADILDISALEIAFENSDYVYHCAAMISFDPKDENLLRKNNIEGTANIVNFCIAKNVKKLCYVSSIAALGDLKSGESVINEESEWNPELNHSDYAISKYGAEMEVWRGFQEGLDVVIVNPGVILGSTIWEEGSGTIINKVKKGIAFYTRGQTAYVGVNDVVKTMNLLMKSSISGERFVLVSAHFTYETILSKIASQLNVSNPKYYVKQWMTNIFWRVDLIFSTFFRTKRILSKNAANSLHAVNQYDNKKIKKALNYEFQSIDGVLEEIINPQ